MINEHSRAAADSVCVDHLWITHNKISLASLRRSQHHLLKSNMFFAPHTNVVEEHLGQYQLTAAVIYHVLHSFY